MGAWLSAWRGVACAIAAACAFGGCSVLQHLTARTEPRRDAWLLLRLVRRPLWLTGGVLNALGVFLQGLALAYVPILVVAPVRLAGLPIALPLTALADRRRVRVDELGAALLCAVGGAGFLLSAGARGGGEAIVPVQVVILLGIVLAVDVTGRFAARVEGGRFVASAAAGGLLNGLNAVLLSTVARGLAADHYRMLAWALPELAFVGLLALLRTQQGLQAPRIGAPLAALTITEPLPLSRAARCCSVNRSPAAHPRTLSRVRARPWACSVPGCCGTSRALASGRCRRPAPRVGS